MSYFTFGPDALNHLAQKVKRTNTKDNTVSFTSEDASTNPTWTNTEVLSSGETHSSIFTKISAMFKNVRYLYSKIGTKDVSTVGGDGTITDAIVSMNTSLDNSVEVDPTSDEAETNPVLESIDADTLGNKYSAEDIDAIITSLLQLSTDINTIAEATGVNLNQ